jgi:hypothetical protein
MNHREPPHLPAGVRRALHCLSLLLLPAMAPDGVHAIARSRPTQGGALGAGSTPYLPVAGSPPLRFQEAAPPPDLTTRPAAAAPPTPALTPTESSVAQANADASRSTTIAEPAQSQPAAPTAEKAPAKDAPLPRAKTPPPILPDDARPAVRPEDFLPYFQIPGSAQNPSDVTLLVPAPRSAPAPAPLPPSSATYTQTPK